jgi:hypothetical protein
MSQAVETSPPPSPSPPRTYGHSKVVRAFIAAFLLLVLIGMGLIGLAWAAAGRLTEALPPDLTANRSTWSQSTLQPGTMAAVLFLLGILALWLVLLSVSVNRRIRVDERGIERLGILGARRIHWAQVKELTLGGTATFAEGPLGTKLFVEGRDGRLIAFTNRLRGAGELIEIIEARTGLSFASPEDEVILPIDRDPEETEHTADRG